MTDVNDFLDQVDYDRHDAFKFPTIGTKIVGRIVSTPRVVESTDFNGEPTRNLVVDVTDDAGETWAVWVKPNAMGSAVAKAVKQSGATGLEEGGTFGLAYTGDGQAKPGQNPPKQYQATYTAPAASVDPSDIFGG